MLLNILSNGCFKKSIVELHLIYKIIILQPAINNSASPKEKTSSTHELLPMFRPAAQSTSPQANKSQTKSRKTTGEDRNGPCCYIHIPCTSAHIFTFTKSSFYEI
jgi:hypothetical protein